MSGCAAAFPSCHYRCIRCHLFLAVLLIRARDSPPDRHYHPTAPHTISTPGAPGGSACLRAVAHKGSFRFTSWLCCLRLIACHGTAALFRGTNRLGRFVQRDSGYHAKPSVIPIRVAIFTLHAFTAHCVCRATHTTSRSLPSHYLINHCCAARIPTIPAATVAGSDSRILPSAQAHRAPHTARGTRTHARRTNAVRTLHTRLLDPTARAFPALRAARDAGSRHMPTFHCAHARTAHRTCVLDRLAWHAFPFRSFLGAARTIH